MTIFKIGDIVKVIKQEDLWYGYHGLVKEVGTYGVLVVLDKPIPQLYRTTKDNLQRALPKHIFIKKLTNMYES